MVWSKLFGNYAFCTWKNMYRQWSCEVHKHWPIVCSRRPTMSTVVVMLASDKWPFQLEEWPPKLCPQTFYRGKGIEINAYFLCSKRTGRSNDKERKWRRLHVLLDINDLFCNFYMTAFMLSIIHVAGTKEKALLLLLILLLYFQISKAWTRFS
jgi:hypothetical protein